MCRTVRFAEGIGELLKEKERVLLEVGAGQSWDPSSNNILTMTSRVHRR